MPLFPVDVGVWMDATRELTAGTYPQGHKINEAFIGKAVPVIERQLAFAGIELWKALHQVAQYLTAVRYMNMGVPEEKISQSVDR